MDNEENMAELQGNPAYTGMTKHIPGNAGYAIWLPSDWHETKMKKGHNGAIFSPYKDDINTCFLAEKHMLKYSVKPDDMPVLREGFLKGINALPGVEIEKTDEFLSEAINFFEARFTYLEGEARRKRWVKNIYWGNGQLLLIAQGKNEEDFKYWESMFFNTMYTVELL